jgi:hypothetical protein
MNIREDVDESGQGCIQLRKIRLLRFCSMQSWIVQRYDTLSSLSGGSSKRLKELSLVLPQPSLGQCREEVHGRGTQY